MFGMRVNLQTVTDRTYKPKLKHTYTYHNTNTHTHQSIQTIDYSYSSSAEDMIVILKTQCTAKCNIEMQKYDRAIEH